MRTTATGGCGPLDGKRDLLAFTGENRAPSPFKEVSALSDRNSDKYPAHDAVPGLRGAAISEHGPFFEIYAVSFIALFKAWKRTLIGKSRNMTALSYSSNVIEWIFALAFRLRNSLYKIKGYRRFTVHEPKKREILAIDFESKIVLHSLCDNILEPLLCKSFIKDNYANQRGKGMHYGLAKLSGYMRDLFLRNKGHYEAGLRDQGIFQMPMVKDWNYNTGWVIKGDIRKYFYNIDHGILRTALARKLGRMEDKKTAAFAFWLCDKIINSTPNPGIPIGNQTSQLFALLYLDGLDHYIKDTLGLPYYGRYMDDFYIIVNTKDDAVKILGKIKTFVKDLKLELNEKTQIFPLSHGIDFLGFHTYLDQTGKVVRIIRRKSKINMKRKIKVFRKLYDRGAMSLSDVYYSFQSWKAHAVHGNTRRLIRAMDKYLYSIFPELPGKEIKHEQSSIDPKRRR
jgi:retron-type reverse transcriptase